MKVCEGKKWKRGKARGRKRENCEGNREVREKPEVDQGTGCKRTEACVRSNESSNSYKYITNLPPPFPTPSMIYFAVKL